MSAVASNVIRMSVICYHPQFLVRIIRIKVNPNHPQVKVIITILGRSREVVDGAVCRDHASKLIRDFISLCQHEEEDEAGLLIGGMSFPLSSFSCICSCIHLVYLCVWITCRFDRNSYWSISCCLYSVWTWAVKYWKILHLSMKSKQKLRK